MDLSSVFLAAIGIGLLIFLHELGHFAAARAAGVRVEVFSLGFGPRLFGRRIGATDFRVSLVPFGGYVMVAGQDPGDDRFPAEQCLWSKTVAQRAMFWSGGVVMNVLFALIVFPLVFRAGVSFLAPVVGSVALGGPAWEAGLQPGDRIVSIGAKPTYSFENFGVEVALHGPRPLDLLVRGGDGTERVVTVVPRYSPDDGLCTIGIGTAEADEAPTLEVADGSPAAAAGLRTGDVLVRLGARPARGDELRKALDAMVEAGAAPVDVEVQRDGSTLTARVTPRLRPDAAPLLVGVEPLRRQVVGIRRGNGAVDRLGLQRGDVVLAVDGRPFVQGDLAAWRTGTDDLQLLVLRAGQRLALATTCTAEERRTAPDHVALGADESLMLSPRPDGAARAAGLQAGDRVLAVDDKPIADWSALQEIVKGGSGAPLRFRLRRPPAAPDSAYWAQSGDLAGDVVELVIAPQRRPVHEFGFVPLVPQLRQEVQAEDFGAALRLGTICSLDLVKQLYVTLKRLVTGEVGAKNLSGIVGISRISYQAAQRGSSWFWYFLALLSLNLAFVNLLPIPVLDGGHLLFLLIERIKGSPVSTRVLGYSQVLGLVFVLLLVLFVTYNDILRLL